MLPAPTLTCCFIDSHRDGFGSRRSAVPCLSIASKIAPEDVLGARSRGAANPHHHPGPGPQPGPGPGQPQVHRGGPGRLHVADFTYVPLDGGRFGYTAFVIDAFARLIAGWDCSLSKDTVFVEKAIRQAAELRARQGHAIGGRAIHHSDADSPG